ncbi:hypothetical protein ACTXT7_003933 [Hymenolepis weldensis]
MEKYNTSSFYFKVLKPILFIHCSNSKTVPIVFLQNTHYTSRMKDPYTFSSRHEEKECKAKRAFFSINIDDVYYVKMKRKTLTPCMNNIRDELQDLSTYVLKNRQAFYKSVQERRDNGNVEEVDGEAKDCANVIAALKREHEEEKLRLLQDVKQNWFHRDYYDAYTTQSELQLKSLHSQLNRICADIINKGERNGTSSHSPVAKFAKAQEIIRDRRFSIEAFFVAIIVAVMAATSSIGQS